MAVAVNVNAGEVKGTVSPLGSTDKSAETIPIREFLLMP